MDYDEGFKGNPKRQNSKQPSGGMGGGFSNGSFGKHSGSSKTDGGVTYDAGAGDACSNKGNYNVTEGKAREFGTGGAMRGR